MHAWITFCHLLVGPKIAEPFLVLVTITRVVVLSVRIFQYLGETEVDVLKKNILTKKLRRVHFWHVRFPVKLYQNKTYPDYSSTTTGPLGLKFGQTIELV